MVERLSHRVPFLVFAVKPLAVGNVPTVSFLHFLRNAQNEALNLLAVCAFLMLGIGLLNLKRGGTGAIGPLG